MKRGQSEIITILIIIVLIILSVILLWQISKNLLEKNKEELTLDRLSDSIIINERSSFIGNNNNLIQLQLTRRADNIDINSLQIIALTNDKTLTYIIEDYPENLETKNYILNISEIKQVNEILIYPVLQNRGLGIGERLFIEDIKQNTGQIDTTLDVINPININNINNPESLCIPKFSCGNWDDCHVVYDLDDIVNGSITLEGLQERKCIDNNQCSQDINEKKSCETKIQIEIEKVNVCENKYQYLEITNSNTKELISRLELTEGKLNIQFLFSNTTKYYPYCFNNIQDCDEDGIDCVDENSNKDSCPVCE